MRDRNFVRDPSVMRAIRGPVTLITVGLLFALNNFTQYTFDKTWPVLLIVFGLMSLMRRSLEPVPPPPPPAQPFPPPAYAYTPQASYAQSSYAQPPQPAKGGFGSSAPRPSEPVQNPPAAPAEPGGEKI